MNSFIALILILMCSATSVFAEDSIHSPQSVSLDLQVHWRGSWGNTRVYTHYSIIALVNNKQIAEFTHNYHIRDRFDGSWERFQADRRAYQEILKTAQAEGKLVRVTSSNDNLLRNGIQILAIEDLVEISSNELEQFRCLSEKILSGDPTGEASARNRRHIQQMEDLLKHIKQRVERLDN
jgi:hypothetical protein